MRMIAVILSFFLLSFAAQAGNLEGYWYGEGWQPMMRVYMQWISHYKADHTFVIEFRRYENCQLVQSHMEAGNWTPTKRGWNTTTTALNFRPLQSQHRDDEYVIEKDGDNEVHYRHVAVGQRWMKQRVNSDFKFKACVPTS